MVFRRQASQRVSDMDAHHAQDGRFGDGHARTACRGVEEIDYRFALLGIVWLQLRPYWGRLAPWLAGLVALLLHMLAHESETLLTNRLMDMGFGIVLALVSGVPTTILALRRDSESAMGFHWVQDAVRFLGGL